MNKYVQIYCFLLSTLISGNPGDMLVKLSDKIIRHKIFLPLDIIFLYTIFN